MIWFYLLSVVHLWASTANDCATVGNLAKNNGAVFHQRNFSWCHSLTTTDLLTQKMLRTGHLKTGQRLHPFGTAAVLHIMRGSSPDEGRYLNSTVVANLNTLGDWNAEGGKLCLERDFGSTNYSLNRVAGLSNTAQADILRKNFAYVDGEFVRIGEFARSCPTPTAAMKLISEMKTAERKTWIDAMNRKCATAMPPITWRYKWDPRWTDEINGTLKGPPDPERASILKSEIDGALDQGAMVGVEYKPNFMMPASVPPQGNHWSSVVARERRTDGQCYYQIRNFWGLSCRHYRQPSNCSAGNIWVKREDLVKHTDATTYLP